MEIREGFKQTDIGNIPSEWDVIPIGEIFDFEGGSQPPRDTFIFQEQEGFIRLLQIRDYKTEKYASFIPSHLARKKCNKEDIMIGRYGPPIFQILRGLEGAYNVALIKAIPKQKIAKEFGWFILTKDTLFEFVEKLSQRSSGQTGVDLNELKKYQIPLPPTKLEQTAIATALSDADALITSLEKLIAKKRLIKQGAMQELLSPTGSDGKPKEGWVVKKLGEVILLKNGYAFSSEFFSNSGPIVITPGNFKLDGGLLFNDRNTLRYSGNITKEMQFQNGDLLIVMTDLTPSCNLLGKPGIVNSDEIILHNQRIGKISIKNKSVNQNYLYWFLASELFSKRMKETATGSTVRHTSVGSINGTILSIPSFEEQTRIATILSDMDAEITTLEAKLEKYRKIKLGMMQELLTGRIRLI